MAPPSESGSTEPAPAEPEPAKRRSVLPGPDRDRLRRRQIVGILLVAAAILVFSLLRARWHDLFPQGWWRW